MKTVNVGNIKIGGNQPLALLAGPCVLEGFERSLKIGKAIKEITQRQEFLMFLKPLLTKQIALHIVPLEVRA